MFSTIWETMRRALSLSSPGHHVPANMLDAGGLEAVAVHLLVRLPVEPFMGAGEAGLPVLLRCVDARPESLRLYVFR